MIFLHILFNFQSALEGLSLRCSSFLIPFYQFSGGIKESLSPLILPKKGEWKFPFKIQTEDEEDWDEDEL